MSRIIIMCDIVYFMKAFILKGLRIFLCQTYFLCNKTKSGRFYLIEGLKSTAFYRLFLYFKDQ